MLGPGVRRRDRPSILPLRLTDSCVAGHAFCNEVGCGFGTPLIPGPGPSREGVCKAGDHSILPRSKAEPSGQQLWPGNPQSLRGRLNAMRHESQARLLRLSGGQRDHGRLREGSGIAAEAGGPHFDLACFRRFAGATPFLAALSSRWSFPHVSTNFPQISAGG